jgi:hypothetical protein
VAEIATIEVMSVWHGDDELFALARRELFTSVVGDVMDKLQLFHQFLPPAIQPLQRDMVLIGRAMPVLSVDVFEEQNHRKCKPVIGKTVRLDAGSSGRP